MTLSVPGVGPDHITQICAMGLQSLKKRTTSASTVAAKAILQESALADQMITEEPRSTPRDLHDCRMGNTGSKTHNFNMNKDSHHQTRFNKRYNRQYLPNYNNFQQSLLGSFQGRT